MPVTLEQLRNVQAGDALYLTTRPLPVLSVEEGCIRAQYGRYIEHMPVSEGTAYRIRRIVPASKRRKKHTRKEYAFAASDGGRRLDSFAHESNDCTVRALALATGATYAEAHAHMRAHGRKDGHGAHIGRAYRASTLGGMVCHAVNSPDTYRAAGGRRYGLSVRQWLTSGELPARCILSVHGHVIAVIDGCVSDTFRVGSRRRVNAVYAFTMPADAPQMPVDAPASYQALMPASSNGRRVAPAVAPVDVARITRDDSARHVWHISRAGAFIGFIEQFAAVPGETHPYKAYGMNHNRTCELSGVCYGGASAFRRAVSAVSDYRQ